MRLSSVRLSKTPRLERSQLVGYLIFLSLFALFLSPLARAQTCIPETEPNNRPDQLLPIKGDFCIEGTASGPDQDMVLWAMPPSGSAFSWNFELKGELGQTVQVRVHKLIKQPDGTPDIGSEIYQLRAEPLKGLAHGREVLFHPGAYIIGVLRDHTGPYKLEVTKSVEDIKRETEPNDSPTSANVIAPGSPTGGNLMGSEDYFLWKISAADARQRWKLKILAPTEDWVSLRLTKFGSDNELLRVSDRTFPYELSDIGLNAGDYIIRLSPSTTSPVPYLLSISPAGPRIPTREDEPNQTLADANALTIGRSMGGRIGWASDVDMYSLEATTALAGKTLTIKVDGAGSRDRQICLQNIAGRDLQCRRGFTPKLENLNLPVGKYGIYVAGQPDPAHPYVLSANIMGMRADDAEMEPNDTIEMSTEFFPKKPIRATIAKDDIDHYRVAVTGEPQLWKFYTTGKGVSNVTVLDLRQNIIGTGQRASDSETTEATDVYLLPGMYWVAIKGQGIDGKAADYALTAEPIGAPDPSAEREPNDDDRQAHRVRFGFPRHGKLADSSDRDCYRFSLAAPEHVAIELDPPKDGDVSFEIEWGYPSKKLPRMENVTKHMVYDAVLEPGDYTIRLRSNKPNQEPYTLALNRLDIFSLPADLEPNDTPPQARPLPADFTVSGEVGQFGDEDWYSLPVSTSATILTVTVNEGMDLKLKDGLTDVANDWDAKTHILTAKIPADRRLKLGVRGRTSYKLQVSFGDDGPKPRNALTALPLELKLSLEDKPITPYWVRGQRIQGSVSLTNKNSDRLNLTLSADSSHVSYLASLKEQNVTLAANATTSVPIEVSVAPDAWAGDAVQIAVGAQADGFIQASTSATVTVDANALPLRQEISFPIPKALRGGFDVAWAALGALPVTEGESNADDIRNLFDGLVATKGFVMAPENLPKTLTVKFGGDKSWPIAGITLHPQIQGRLYPAEQLADFDLLLSADGTTFEKVLSDHMNMLPIEQAFVLSKPFTAKAAQLTLKTNHADNMGHVGLSEWKVISTPGSTGENSAVSINVADPDRGGHVVRSDPIIGASPDGAKSILLDGGRAEDSKVSEGQSPSFVIGFHENRAAMITSLEWVQAPETSGYDRFWEVDLEASVDGPLGPWRPLTHWSLKFENNDSDSRVSKIALTKPEWVRFLRVKSTRVATNSMLWKYPTALRVFERPIGGDYLSIIGEWGQFSRDGIYEATHAPAPPALTSGSTSHGSHDQPLRLALATPVTGEVHLGAVEDWYALDIPEGFKTLGITIRGDPFVTAGVELTDSKGKTVALKVVSQSSSDLQLATNVAQGSYLLRVFEPPHQVAITFDTSPSLSDFAPVISHAITTFAEGVTKGREYLNFMNFGGQFLLEHWTDEVWVLAGALAKFQISASDSSDLETTMVSAMEGLRNRQGSRAMVVVTDAETPTYRQQADMWQLLTLIRPRIFTAQIGLGGDPMRQKQLMQDLATVNAGRYSSARTQAEMDVVTERAAAWLRRPARYQLTADQITLPPVRPGSILIKSKQIDGLVQTNAQSLAASAQKPSGAVELILDASGSMLQKLNGRRRIEIAKQTLIDLINRTIPAGTPVAYRIFGDDKPGSCETHLRAPLAPLDRRAMTELFSAIRSVNLAKTAIAASLRSVKDDLKTATGERTVVIVTDGEETCGGDPQKEIETLRSSGIDVRINIVGFAVEAAAIKDTFRTWAKLGGGNYFDARDDKELSKAMKAAVTLPPPVPKVIKVIDSADTQVASGTVGGAALSVPPGIYRIEVEGVGAVFKDIVVEEGDQVTLNY